VNIIFPFLFVKYNTEMKVAIVFYGQPRNYADGFKNIQSFIQNQTDVQVDFFYHCWTIGENEKYAVSNWREISEEDKSFKKNVKDDLLELYKPVSHEYEQQKTDFDESLYMNTLAHKIHLSHGNRTSNINNLMSQSYSKNKARDLVDAYIKNTGTKYDFVVITRFDIACYPRIKLIELDKSRVYLSNIMVPRKIFADAFIVAPTEVFLTWFDGFYTNLNKFINSEEVLRKLNSIGEHLILHSEELVTAKYIFHYSNLDNVVFHPLIPNVLCP
jgi:hypothetical protein